MKVSQIKLMEMDELLQIKSRLYRLERQNRWLVLLLCAVAGAGSIAAARHGGNIIDADEVRAQRFTLIDFDGKICSYQQGVSGTVSEGGPITDYPALSPRPPGAPVYSKWKHFSLFP
jgi:hypothetical protein